MSVLLPSVCLLPLYVSTVCVSLLCPLCVFSLCAVCVLCVSVIGLCPACVRCSVCFCVLCVCVIALVCIVPVCLLCIVCVCSLCMCITCVLLVRVPVPVSYVSAVFYMCVMCVCVPYLSCVCVPVCLFVVLLVTLLVWRLSWWCDGRLFFGFGGLCFLGGVACWKIFVIFIWVLCWGSSFISPLLWVFFLIAVLGVVFRPEFCRRYNTLKLCLCHTFMIVREGFEYGCR